MTRTPALTKAEAEALAKLTDAFQSPDDLGVSHTTMHSLFLHGLAERTAGRAGRRWINHYRRMPAGRA